MKNKATQLRELAERCEAASGPDRFVGAEIEIALRGFPERAFYQRSAMRPKGAPEPDRLKWAAEWFGPGPTAFLDAAVSLVPEGFAFGTGRGTEEPDVEGWAWCGPDEGPFSFAATPALALTAAALKAHASLLDKEPQA